MSKEQTTVYLMDFTRAKLKEKCYIEDVSISEYIESLILADVMTDEEKEKPFIDSEMYSIPQIYVVISKKFRISIDYQTLKEELTPFFLKKVKRAQFDYYYGEELNKIINKIVEG
jgi:hypothetical protein